MINSIYLHNLRNGEYIQLIADILAIVAKNDPKALKVEEPYNLLKIAFRKYGRNVQNSAGQCNQRRTC
jgi:hypothetical protein